MKVNINQIPAEGLSLTEKVEASALDLETETVKFSGPISIRAGFTRVTNVVSVEASLEATMRMSCSRCLEEFDAPYSKDVRLNYRVGGDSPQQGAGRPDLTIEIDDDVRGEMILDYPIRPLCKPDCKGLCPKCGKNLNEGGCSCGTT